MIDFRKINTSTEEGKLLIAALAKISTDSEEGRTLEDLLKELTKMSKKIFND